VAEELGRLRKGLESIPQPYRSLVAELLKGLLEVFGDKLVSLVVFGSVARGEARRDSDVDVLIVVEGLPRGRFRRVELFEKATEKVEPLLEQLWDQGYAVDFSPIILTPEEAGRTRPIYLDMVVDAVIVYDKGGFMENILKRVARRLRELGAKRVRLGRLWYWVLKNPYRFGEVIEI
jgi:predicted nucleotidyltransferase